MDDSMDRRTEDRLDELPEHERDDDRSIGAGVMSAGGTAIDRGTGELSGMAQGDRDLLDADDDDILVDDASPRIGE
jgi:hypothetical protein